MNDRQNSSTCEDTCMAKNNNDPSIENRICPECSGRGTVGSALRSTDLDGRSGIHGNEYRIPCPVLLGEGTRRPETKDKQI
jgi:hypothetical protein